jgi:hypothetical protein
VARAPGAGGRRRREDPADPDGLVVAAKGGHNGEHHNYNDCGTSVVHHRRKSLLTDLDAPTCNADCFGDGRYENIAARSSGHSVPLVNGCEQAAGVDRAARVIGRESIPTRDAIALELADCYPGGAGLGAPTDDRDVWRARFAPRDRTGSETAVELTVEVAATGAAD